MKIKNLKIRTKIKLSTLHSITISACTFLIYTALKVMKTMVFNVLYLDFEKNEFKDFLSVVFLAPTIALLSALIAGLAVVIAMGINHIRKIWDNYLVQVIEDDGKSYVTDRKDIERYEKKR